MKCNDEILKVSLGILGRSGVFKSAIPQSREVDLSQCFSIDTTSGILSQPGTYIITIWVATTRLNGNQIGELDRVTLIVKEPASLYPLPTPTSTPKLTRISICAALKNENEYYSYIAEQCNLSGMPIKLGIAVAYADRLNGFPLMQIKEGGKLDWQSRVSLALDNLKIYYMRAFNAFRGNNDEIAKAAYSGYDDSNNNIYRYQSNQHPNDQTFWRIYSGPVPQNIIKNLGITGTDDPAVKSKLLPKVTLISPGIIQMYGRGTYSNCG